MASILGILALVAALGSLVFFIMVLIKLFQAKGALHGILGILCGLYTFIWGWMNADAQGIRTTMVRWTICIIAQIVLNVGAMVLGGGAVPASLPAQP